MSIVCESIKRGNGKQMKIQPTNQYNYSNKQNFGSKIVIEGPKRKVLSVFSAIVLSEQVSPLKTRGKWVFETLTTKNLFVWKKLVATGEQDAEALKKFRASARLLKSGYATKPTFDQATEGLPVLSAKKVLKAIKNKKFDFSTLTIQE